MGFLAHRAALVQTKRVQREAGAKKRSFGQKKIPVSFKRQFMIKNREITLSDKLEIDGKIKFKKLSFGDEFFVRFKY